MATEINPWQYQSYLSQPITMNNFVPMLSAKITTSGTSQSIVWTPLVGALRTTFKITNTGDKGAYIAWGVGTATAVASSGTPAPYCDYVAAGAIITQDYQHASGVVNVIAALQDTSPTTLEITLGYGQ